MTLKDKLPDRLKCSPLLTMESDSDIETIAESIVNLSDSDGDFFKKTEKLPFMGCDVLAVALDGIPVKNHLPAPLAAALKTANQWRELGFSPKPGAKKFNLHPNCMAKRTYTYFYKDDVMDDRGHTPDESGSYLLHEDQLIANLEESTGHGGLRSYGYTAF